MIHGALMTTPAAQMSPFFNSYFIFFAHNVIFREIALIDRLNDDEWGYFGGGDIWLSDYNSIALSQGGYP